MRTNKKMAPKFEDYRKVVSSDKRLTFILKKVKAGVHVERRQVLDHGSNTALVSVQTQFMTEHEFTRFYEADVMRFEYLITYQQLTREFNDLLDSYP